MTKYLILWVSSILTYSIAIGQTNRSTPKPANTKEVRINYTNGLEVINVYVLNPNIKYYDSVEYTWYTEFSKIKSTKGGSGGLLLHGIYKFYDEYGNLRIERNYSNGRLNGFEKYWDSLGNISEQNKYKFGECVYLKFKNDKEQWVEFIGPIFEKGTVRKIFTKYNKLVEIDTQYSFSTESITLFYENSTFRKSYFQVINQNVMNGIYKSFYENGKLEEKGQYWDSAFSVEIKIGTWVYYNIDGTKIYTKYKRGVEYWENGKIKAEGTLVFDKIKKEWLKDDIWQFYSSEGKIGTRLKYIKDAPDPYFMR